MPTKKKIIFKKKKPIVNKFLELTFDTDIVPIKSSGINYDLVKKIISLNSIKKMNSTNSLNTPKQKKTRPPIIINEPEFINKDELMEDNIDDDEEESLVNTTDVEMIDKDELIKDSIGGKTIYYDYDKNIIYNKLYEVIGSIADNEFEFYDKSYTETVDDTLEMTKNI